MYKLTTHKFIKHTGNWKRTKHQVSCSNWARNWINCVPYQAWL